MDIEICNKERLVCRHESRNFSQEEMEEHWYRKHFLSNGRHVPRISYAVPFSVFENARKMAEEIEEHMSSFLNI